MKTKSANLSTYHHSVIAVIVPKLLSRAKEYHKTTTHISAPVMWTLQSAHQCTLLILGYLPLSFR